MLEIVKDERGFLSLFDSLLALFLVFVVFIAFNMVMEIEVPSLSEENKDFKTSQDLMEILSSKATDRDYSTLEIISYTLDYNNNSLAISGNGSIFDSLIKGNSSEKSSSADYFFMRDSQDILQLVI